MHVRQYPSVCDPVGEALSTHALCLQGALHFIHLSIKDASSVSSHFYGVETYCLLASCFPFHRRRYDASFSLATILSGVID